MTDALNRELILRAFAMMADHLGREGVRGEIVIAGGAVMALECDVDRVTRDVDGLISENHGAVIKAAHAIAAQLNLPRGWLNEGVATYLSTTVHRDQKVVFDAPSLIVYAASTEHLLALKARASRPHDVDDLRVLFDIVGIESPGEVFAIVNQFFPDDPLSERSQAVIEDLLA